MDMFNMQEFQQQVDGIVQDYLYSICSLKKHNYFKKDEAVYSRTKYYQSKHSFYVSHDCMPLEMKPIMLKKKN